MAALPVVKVLLADPSNPASFIYDISAYVRMTDGVTIKRGQSDEFGTPQPGSVSLTLDNSDGRFTLGHATATSAYGLVTDQAIRIVVTVDGVENNRFDGFVEAWPTAWTNGSARQARAQITAYDWLARLARRKLRSLYMQEVLASGPICYLALSEATTRTTSDKSLAPALTTTGTGTAPTYGVTINGAPGLEGATGATFNAGVGMRVQVSSIPNTGPRTIEILFQQAAAPGQQQAIAGIYGAAQLVCTTGGKARVLSSNGTTVCTSTATITDGQAHHLAVAMTGSTWTLYVDGTADGSGTGSTAGSFTPLVFLVGITAAYSGTDPSPSTATLAGAAIYGSTALTSSVIALHASTALTSTGTETARERAFRICRYANVNANTYTGTSATIGTQALDGLTVSDALNAVAAADGGVVFCNTIGAIEFWQASFLSSIATDPALLTLSANAGAVLAGVTFPGDKQYLQNAVTAALPEGPTVTLTNTTSVAAHEEYPVDLGVLPLSTEAALIAAVQDRLDRYSEPDPERINSLPITLVDRDDSVITLADQQAWASSDLFFRLDVTDLPAQAPASSLSLMVVGYTETLTVSSWTVDLNTVPVAAYA